MLRLRHLELVGVLYCLRVHIVSSLEVADVAPSVNLVQSDLSDEDMAQCQKLVQMLDIRGDELTSEEASRVRSFVLQSQDVFAVEKGELGEVNELYHHIHTGDSPPVRQPPCRVPFALRPEITRMVNEMLQAGVICESASPWASPVVFVKKKDGSL